MKGNLCLLLLLSFGSLQAQSTLAGIWNTGQENSRVEITAVDGGYFGTLISSDNENARIGTQLLKDVKPDGNGWKGTLYAPRRQAWYDATLEVEGDVLEITIGSGLLSKTVTWRREQE